MSVTNDIGFTLTKEQLCKLVDFYATLKELVPPYNRIDAVLLVAKLEQKTSHILLTPYIDQFHNFYIDEYKFLKSKVIHL